MDVPLALLVAAASAGWGLVGWVVRLIVRGQLLTPREARAMETRAENAEKAGVVKDKTIAEFADAASTTNALIASMHDLVREQRR